MEIPTINAIFRIDAGFPSLDWSVWQKLYSITHDELTIKNIYQVTLPIYDRAKLHNFFGGDLFEQIVHHYTVIGLQTCDD